MFVYYFVFHGVNYFFVVKIVCRKGKERREIDLRGKKGTLVEMNCNVPKISF